ncbi:MAG: OadG family protein [Lachnospiraceae bacterium]|nr:OadG family protein [Lachnospiraceae bacterium]
MKKKILAFLCVITCVFGLAACGEPTYTEVQQYNMAHAEQLSSILVNVAQQLGSDEMVAELSNNYKKHESAALLESITSNYYGEAVEAEFGVFEGMLNTYAQASKDMGGITSVGNHTTEIVGKEIVVIYELTGNEANGTFKFEFTNDSFAVLTGAEALAKLTFAQNMAKAGSQMKNAALNTVLGMGTVFVVLILISLIISSFSLFGKANKPAPKKEEVKETPSAPVEEELSDDTELVAVIMAAISAYEGNASTDGYVVRSIRRANRRN